MKWLENLFVFSYVYQKNLNFVDSIFTIYPEYHKEQKQGQANGQVVALDEDAIN